jgi:hypothetical protein
MGIDEELRRVLLNLLGTGLLRIRALGWAGRAEDCAVEADHLHNLPRLTLDPKMELVKSYYTIARPVFIKESKDSTKQFEPDWKRLGEILDEMESKGASNRTTER